MNGPTLRLVLGLLRDGRPGVRQRADARDRTADLREGRLDTALGALLATIAAIATVVVAAPLFANHGDVSKMNTGADFATALQPLIGTGGATLFALGIIKSGSVSRGRWFYGVTIISVLVAAGVVLVPGTPLVALTLTVNVIATMFMAPALLLLLLLVNDREIMGTHANGWGMNLAGSTIVIGIALVGAFYGVITVFPHLLTTGA